MTVKVLRGDLDVDVLKVMLTCAMHADTSEHGGLYLPESGRSSIVADGAGAGRVLPVAVRASSNLAFTQSRSRLIRGE